MTRVVFDTNVWISALLFGGKPRQVLQICTHGEEFDLFCSEPILEEFSRVVSRPKFALPDVEIERMLRYLRESSRLVIPRTTVSAVLNDPADNRILECALAAVANCIVSGDEHLLTLGTFSEITIVTPAQFLRQFARNTPG